MRGISRRRSGNAGKSTPKASTAINATNILQECTKRKGVTASDELYRVIEGYSVSAKRTRRPVTRGELPSVPRVLDSGFRIRWIIREKVHRQEWQAILIHLLRLNRHPEMFDPVVRLRFRQQRALPTHLLVLEGCFFENTYLVYAHVREMFLLIMIPFAIVFGPPRRIPLLPQRLLCQCRMLPTDYVPWRKLRRPDRETFVAG